MKSMLLVLAVLLTGCATTKPDVVTVKVAVPVACQIAEPERPAMPTDELPLDAKPDVQARYLRAEIDVREAYEDRLVTALRGCKAPVKPL